MSAWTALQDDTRRQLDSMPQTNVRYAAEAKVTLLLAPALTLRVWHAPPESTALRPILRVSTVLLGSTAMLCLQATMLLTTVWIVPLVLGRRLLDSMPQTNAKRV